MDIMRMALVVIVAYILGLGTGLVGGVVFSLKEFAAPAGAVVATTGSQSGSAATPSSDRSAKPEKPASGDEEEASERETPRPEASAPAKSASPRASARPSTLAMASASPLPSAEVAEATPSDEESTTSGAVSEHDTPSAEPSAETAPEASPSPTPSRSSLLVVANKGKGFAVYVDGEKRGATPVTVEVAPGRTHTVKVVGGEKFKSWQTHVKPDAGEKLMVKAVLAYIPPPPPAPVAAPAPRYYPPAPAPRYVPSYGGGGGGRPGVTGSSRW
jgi:hypothetical protein